MKTKRIFFPGTFAVDIEEKKIPETPDDEKIYVKNRASVISPGTELSLYTGIHSGLKDPANTWAKFPFYPGYSASGEVIAAGKSVKDFRAGDRVAHLGTHESITSIAAGDAVRIPDGLDDVPAAFSVLGYIALQGARMAGIRLGESVVVIGAGIIGQFAVQFARLAGAGTVICSDLSAARLGKARISGADAIINPGKDNQVERVKELTGGRGADVVIEATGSPPVIPEAVKSAADLGKVILLGSPRGKVEMDFYPDVHCRGLQIIGAHVATNARVENRYNRWTRNNNWKAVIDKLKRGQLKAEHLITRRVPPDGPDDIRTCYEGLLKDKEDYLAVVIDWKGM